MNINEIDDVGDIDHFYRCRGCGEWFESDRDGGRHIIITAKRDGNGKPLEPDYEICGPIDKISKNEVLKMLI